MKIPDIKLNYPNGSKALEVTGIDGTLFEHIALGRGMMHIMFDELPKLQPLIDNFYQMYQKIKKVA